MTARTTLSSLLLPLLLLAACGGNVVVDGSSSTTGGPGGAGGGSGGAVSTSTSTSGQSTSTGVGGSTSAGCSSADTYFQLVSGSSVSTLVVSCIEFNPPLPVPYGQEIHGGASPGLLSIEGCENAGNGTGIVLVAEGAFAPGTFMIDNATYVHLPPPYPGSGTLTLDEVGPVGGLMVGSFQIGAPPAQVTGKFAVCRAPDIDAP